MKSTKNGQISTCRFTSKDWSSLESAQKDCMPSTTEWALMLDSLMYSCWQRMNNQPFWLKRRLSKQQKVQRTGSQQVRSRSRLGRNASTPCFGWRIQCNLWLESRGVCLRCISWRHLGSARRPNLRRKNGFGSHPELCLQKAASEDDIPGRKRRAFWCGLSRCIRVRVESTIPCANLASQRPWSLEISWQTIPASALGYINPEE